MKQLPYYIVITGNTIPQAMYHFTETQSTISLQPFADFKIRIAVFIILAVAIYFLAPALHWSYSNTQVLQYGGSIALFIAALYDYLFYLKRTIVFDKQKQAVYRSIAGVWHHKLMQFEEVEIMSETVHCSFHYAIARKKNRYGSNYSISGYMSAKERQIFERDILPKIVQILS